MFIRWKMRRLKDRYYRKTDFYSLTAYLVESYRNDNGRTRQRNIAYLGTATFVDGRTPRSEYAVWVWYRFYTMMDKYQVDEVTEAKLTVKLAGKIGLLSRSDAAHEGEKERRYWGSSRKFPAAESFRIT